MCRMGKNTVHNEKHEFFTFLKFDYLLHRFFVLLPLVVIVIKCVGDVSLENVLSSLLVDSKLDVGTRDELLKIEDNLETSRAVATERHLDM